jgi:hypothetical protein
LMQVYVKRGWRFSLVAAECEPHFREPMRTLAIRVDHAALARREAVGREVETAPPIIIR